MVMQALVRSPPPFLEEVSVRPARSTARNLAVTPCYSRHVLGFTAPEDPTGPVICPFWEKPEGL